MGEHSTWFHLFQGFKNLEEWSRHYLEREWRLPVGITDTSFTLTHVMISALVGVLLIIWAIMYRRRIAASNPDRLVPERKFGVRNFFELIIDAAMSMAENVMGRKQAEKHFPLIGTLVFFILLNNMIGLIPGFIPATDTLKTNVAMAVLVFLVYNVAGVLEHGLAYFKHFMGPIWWLSWLMLPIEIFSHCVRPVSLSLRLLGNMAADHKVLAIFTVLVPVLVPLPFYVLGILVCVVQTLVFSLLSMVYIGMAVAHEEH